MATVGKSLINSRQLMVTSNTGDDKQLSSLLFPKCRESDQMDEGKATGGSSKSGGGKVGEFLRCSEQLNPEEQQTLSHSQTTSVIEEEVEEFES